MPASVKVIKEIPASATIRSFLIPPAPLAVVPIVKKDGKPANLFLVRNEEESANITRRICRGLEKEGIAAYANKDEKRPDTDSWLFATTQATKEQYCPKELCRGAAAATALAKNGPIIAERNPSNPVCLLCREHCENKWGNSHGFISHEEEGEETPPICDVCNEHEIYYRINHPNAIVVLLPPQELEQIARIPTKCACGEEEETEFFVRHNRASKPVLLEFNNITSSLDKEIKDARPGADVIYVARIAEMEAALADYRDYKARKIASQVAREPDNVVSTAEVKKPSKKERQADATRGANAVRDQKKKEREAFEKECEKAAKAALAIKRAADEKKRKAKAAKAKVAKACP